MSEFKSAITAVTFEETEDGKLHIKIATVQRGVGEERLVAVTRRVLQFIVEYLDMNGIAEKERLAAHSPKEYDA